MERTKLALLMLVAVIFFTILAQTSYAQLRQLELRVDGLACPFCAYGLEKNLKALKGAKRLEIDINQGIVTIFPKEGELIPIHRLREAVKDSGFTPRGIKLTLVGRVTPLAEVKENPKYVKMVSAVQKAAKSHGLKLPDSPLALAIEKPEHIFLLLSGRDKAHQAQFEKLSSAIQKHQELVITGAVPERKDKTKSPPVALLLLNFKPDKAS
jgi:mercuric ion binding protein